MSSSGAAPRDAAAAPGTRTGSNDAAGESAEAKDAAAAAGPAADSLAIFADPAGRRRITVQRLAAGTALLMLGYLVLTAVGLLGGPRAPLVPWPALKAQPRSGPVHGVPGTHQPAGGSPAGPAGPAGPALPLHSPEPSAAQRTASRAPTTGRAHAPRPSRTPRRTHSPAPSPALSPAPIPGLPG